jgi:hypothetical protein
MQDPNSGLTSARGGPAHRRAMRHRNQQSRLGEAMRTPHLVTFIVGHGMALGDKLKVSINMRSLQPLSSLYNLLETDVLKAMVQTPVLMG